MTRPALHAPVDIASLVAFRMLFGAIVAWEATRYFWHGWIGAFYVRPRFHFTYEGFGWVTPWAGDGMYVHFAMLVVLGLAVSCGLWYRASAALLCVGLTYVFLLDQTQYLNHVYLLCLLAFLMSLVPAHRSASLDSWRRPALRADTAPAWALWCLRAQLALVYFYAGLAKVNADWLRGEPLQEWLAARTSVPLIGAFFRERWCVFLCAYGSLLLDLLIAPALLWRRTRLPAVALVVSFHLLNWQLFGLGIFPWLMIGATTLFLPPEWPRRLGARLWLSYSPRPRVVTPRPVAERAVLVLLGAHFIVQILVPLRHFLYPGNVSWTEEGHRFAWHLMLREKHAHVTLVTIDPATGERSEVPLARYVTPRQRVKMASRPDLIHQFARHIASEHQRNGQTPVAVHALATASLNGRPRQWLVDPRVDLGAKPWTLWPAPWIVPLGTTLPIPLPREPRRDWR